jgi:ribosomal-protein-alanine N-acetyltransferase
MIRKKYVTRRLILRPITKRDFKTWQDYYSLWDEKPQSKYDLPVFTKKECSKKTFEKIVKRHQRFAKEDKVYVWGAFCKKSKELVAVLDLGIIHRDEYQMANLGYRVGHRYWRQGFATEIIKCGCKKIAKDLKLQRLQAAINLDNRPSMKTARASGLYREGIKRKYLLEKGIWTDNVIYVHLVN